MDKENKTIMLGDIFFSRFLFGPSFASSPYVKIDLDFKQILRFYLKADFLRRTLGDNQLH